MTSVCSKLLALPVVLSVVLSLGMDRKAQQGYRILGGIAYRAYDGDSVAMRRLVSAAGSENQALAKRAPWLLSASLNPDNVPILAEIYETSDETIRATIQRSLSFLRTDHLGRIVLKALAEQGGTIGTFAEELFAEPHKEAPTDEETRQALLNESPQDRAHRDSLFAEFEQADALLDRCEILWKLSPLGEERLVPYIDDLLAQLDAEPHRSRPWGCRYLVFPIVRLAALKEGTELPITDRQELYNRIISALVEEEPALLDLCGQPVKLPCPTIGYHARTERTIYIDEAGLEGIRGLELEGYKTPMLSIWEIMSLANKRKWGLDHLCFGRIYVYRDYAVVTVSYLPTSCIRHPGPWVSGSSSHLLLEVKDGEWRFRAVLSSLVS
jgi:hypothetical protein